jgi:hypothetical protein
VTLTWEEIRARSVDASGTLCCADCYFAFELLGSACAKHSTPEEKERELGKLKEQSMREHPVFEMVPKHARADRPRENEVPLTRFDFKVPKR